MVLVRNGRLRDSQDQVRLPEEVPSGSTYSEGSVQRILVNRYERDPRAREECIRHYGTTCFLCGFDFVAAYGEVMTGFIHVHHLNPLSSIGADYEVDPIRDLRPVCPNCHAVLHRREPPYSPDEVRQFLQTRGGSA
jgi:5-methylcytosine-specific restriction enzyme A